MFSPHYSHIERNYLSDRFRSLKTSWLLFMGTHEKWSVSHSMWVKLARTNHQCMSSYIVKSVWFLHFSGNVLLVFQNSMSSKRVNRFSKAKQKWKVSTQFPYSLPGNIKNVSKYFLIKLFQLRIFYVHRKSLQCLFKELWVDGWSYFQISYEIMLQINSWTLFSHHFSLHIYWQHYNLSNKTRLKFLV